MDVALFIAGNVRTNVRELEGALNRLIAWSSACMASRSRCRQRSNA